MNDYLYITCDDIPSEGRKTKVYRVQASRDGGRRAFG